MANTNLEAATRELWLRTVKTQVFYRMPVLARLYEGRRITWRGGTKIRRSVQNAEMDSLAQEYTATDPLTAEAKTILAKPEFEWKHFQVPIQYDLDEDLQNDGGREAEVIDLVQYLVKAGQRAARIKLNKMIYDTPTTSADSASGFQSLTDALDQDATYGTLSRSGTTTRKWWQGASLDNTFTDQDTLMSPSIANFRKLRGRVQQYVEKPGDLLAVMGSDIFQQYQAQVEARHVYNRDGSLLAKYGFNTLVLDGVEFVEDPSLNEDYNSGTSGNGDLCSEWFFLLHIPDWEMRIHPRRSLKLTNFTWQGDQANGLDASLARVLCSGNLVCWQPNASAWKSYVA